MGQNSSIPLTNTYSGTPTLGSDPWGSLSQLSSSSCTTCIPMGVFVVVQLLSHVWLFENSWTIAHQAPLSMVFSRQENWIGLLFPSPGNLLTQRSNPHLLHWQADSLPLSHEESLIGKLFTSLCPKVIICKKEKVIVFLGAIVKIWGIECLAQRWALRTHSKKWTFLLFPLPWMELSYRINFTCS